MSFGDISYQLIGCALEVHRELGPGLLESTYERCLAYELRRQGLDCRTQHPQPVCYKGRRLECGYRIDLLVENQLVVEVKSVEAIHPVHKAQLLTYMRLAQLRVGLLINFNVPQLKQGIHRFVL